MDTKRAELIARAFSAAEMNLPIIMSSEGQTKVLKKDYAKKLDEFSLPDPKQISMEQKIDDLTTCPPVTLGHIFQYILNKREFDTGEILTNKADRFIILFCNVRASMSINEVNVSSFLTANTKKRNRQDK